MTPAYIGLGSNLCDPQRQLQSALRAVAALADSRLVQVSSAYRSAAVGPGEQPDYLNAVLRLDTVLAPLALLRALQDIEREQGRIRTVRWGPRSLDLDILLYGELQLDTPILTIPHPGLAQRHFVLYPLAEIGGRNLVLPDGTVLGTLLARCPEAELVKTGLQLAPETSVPGK